MASALLSLPSRDLGGQCITADLRRHVERMLDDEIAQRELDPAGSKPLEPQLRAVVVGVVTQTMLRLELCPPGDGDDRSGR